MDSFARKESIVMKNICCKTDNFATTCLYFCFQFFVDVLFQTDN